MIQLKWVEAKGSLHSHAVHVYKAGGGEVAMVLQYREVPQDLPAGFETTWQTAPVELSQPSAIMDSQKNYPADQFFESIGPGPMEPER